MNTAKLLSVGSRLNASKSESVRVKQRSLDLREMVNDRSLTLIHSNCVLSEVLSIDISDLVLDSL